MSTLDEVENIASMLEILKEVHIQEIMGPKITLVKAFEHFFPNQKWTVEEMVKFNCYVVKQYNSIPEFVLPGTEEPFGDGIKMRWTYYERDLPSLRIHARNFFTPAVLKKMNKEFSQHGKHVLANI